MPHPTRFFLWLVGATAALSLPICAQEAATPPPIEDEVRALSQTLSTLPPEEAQILERDELGPLRDLERITAETKRGREELEGLKEKNTELQNARPDAEGSEGGFSALERLRDELDALPGRSDELERAQKGSVSAIKQAQGRVSELERAERQAGEKLSLAADPGVRGTVEGDIRRIGMQLRLAKQSVTLRETESAVAELKLQIAEREGELLRQRVAQLGERFSLTAKELRNRIQELERLEASLGREADALRVEVATAERLSTDARERVELVESPPPSLLEEARARELARELRERESSLLHDQLSRVALRRSLWNSRFQLLNRTLADLTPLEQEISQRGDDLERTLQQYRLRRDELRQEMESQAAQLKEASDPLLARWLRDQRQYRNRAVAAYDRAIADAQQTRQLVSRLNSELTALTGHFSFTTAVRSVRQWIAGIWEYEITSVDDRPITVRKMFLALLFFIVGIIASRRLSRLLRERVLPRFELPLGASAAVESLAFYILVVTFVFLALRVLHIPLTVFTLLGGAIAIAVGFGSQNILNNFISGLILLVEQPVRVGDLIEIGELRGTVSHIGMRSTRIRTGRNADIVVPNSFFVERTVVNWTLTDDRVRMHVSLGVGYGSNLEEVKRLLLQIADEHEHVMKIPTPFVWLTGFADTSITFELHFWGSLRSFVDRSTIESDIRFRIHERFTRAGISIPIARPDGTIRNVALKAENPLTVRIMR